ncbi:hypothetical protein [Streptomyces sp. NTK 937]|uniref:hypothetical protein n=1 Tax=Streptomyces sp. NTK 937 TaxID=1487711 RepID=UPI0004A97018|nr:hypothetical protein [Streptomyces sp. NTK 937]KDQ65718.1 hypothetical protein DT87_00225 [Streptomyces sp. NTK 937]
MSERQFKDCDGDTWTEYEPGMLRLTERANGSPVSNDCECSIEDARVDHGPLTEIRPDLDPARLERTLRAYVAELDYDTHKGLQCGEGTGVDRYPEEVENFLRFWEAAA